MFKEKLLSNIPFAATKDQERAIDVISQFIFDKNIPIFILKGYAGTGKTTIMAALVKTLPLFKINTVLLAPTGRAAKVLSLYSDKNAFTIHKKIYFSHHEDNEFSFKLKDNKSKDTIFIVDEASMIGIKQDNMFTASNLLDDLMQYVRNGINCKIIFIGDKAQLPPVGEVISPALDEDFMERHFSFRPLSYQLTEVVRQALDSGILRNASNIRFSLYKEKFSLPIFKIQDMVDVKSINGEEFEEYLRQSYKDYGVDETIVICRSNNMANTINNRIRYSILDKENQIDSGDNLMAVKNNYFWLDSYSKEGFIANGDILKIKRIIKYEEAFDLHFADVEVSFVDYNDEQDIELTIILDTLSINKASMDSGSETDFYHKVFNHYYKQTHNKVQAKKNTFQDKFFNAVQVKFSNCLTCHKAQGGGWQSVFLFQSYFTQDMLNKEYFRWLYTATTRAKKQLFLVNFQEDFFKNK
jgi:exodeoxyribonuclease-5